jgi:hypothetical protein
MGSAWPATDNNFHRQVAMVFRECYWLELICIGCFSAVLVLSETVLVLVIEGSLESSYARSSHDLNLKDKKQVPLSELRVRVRARARARARVRVRARARARARGEQIESSNRINHGGTREISLATDKNVHRQVAMVFREC